ncbi:hypothetical protein [Erythrobacter sp. QSSC1-22B]|uniref:hypothetical protein n=1 Tax=Erythrobacter sp. QSSC1-22B TaxID=1860125 RepID=UPI0011A3BCAD|nr:hypothetical protein [Erythrobacter sp. QSSC1-22B]
MDTIRATDEEITMAIHIAVATAPNYAIRNVFKGQALDRTVAVDTLTQRVFRALEQFELTRPAKSSDSSPQDLPMFPSFGAQD